MMTRAKRVARGFKAQVQQAKTPTADGLHQVIQQRAAFLHHFRVFGVSEHIVHLHGMGGFGFSEEDGVGIEEG